MTKLLGIDVGTSGAKAILIDETGRILKTASAEYPLLTPKPGWTEQDPEAWWAGVQKCLAEIGEKPDAIGLTGQMHGATFLDDQDEVIRPALLWNDQRTVEEVALIDETLGPARVREVTLNPPLTGFQVPKILWLKRHEPEAFTRLRSVLLPKDYIRFKLTGAKATDVADASGTGVFDVSQRRWATDLITDLGLDPDLFPQSFESWEVTGRTADGIPVVAGGGDQTAAAVGTGAVTPGILSVSLGTSGVVFSSTESGQADPSGSAHAFCHANGGWHAMGVMLSCGGAVRWARDLLYPGLDYSLMNEEAASAPVGCEGLTFLPYLTGERCPFVAPEAKGAFLGLTVGHHRAHIARATFEGATFGLAGVLDLLRGMGVTGSEVRVTGGGAKSDFWVQMLADVFGRPCVRLDTDEGPAFGAAILAGVGIGVWPDVVFGAASSVRPRDTIKPSGHDYSAALSRFRASAYPPSMS
ncbi:MAG: xylulokinase [Fimbriimonadaceae bacterium]|nr:xylulokinase [Fimbriimonadaceae bacterium]